MLGLGRKHRGKRTVFLGVLASVAFVWAAIDRFDIPAEEMARMFLYSVMAVFFTMLMAAVCMALVIAVKALYRRFMAAGQASDHPE